ncbi:MAG: AAA family ATPase [Candidatus Pacebacteria bacterium]|nr:AAA family ATPase [Candidatus Paceibacterota bacterium]
MINRLIIVGGANGVGKTTFAYQYKQEYGIDYLGADEIAKEISNAFSGNIELRAGKEFFRRLEEYLKRNRSVIIESTLSGLGLVKKIREFKSIGYSIRIVYVFLNDVDICKKRIQFRVKKGGHDVPSIDIERRFHRSLKIFKKVYMPLSDEWQIFYNGLKRPIEVAIGQKKETLVFEEEFYNTFEELCK